ncbi:hypothetical protein scyTo_0001856 [Scyliorhinus torazame]|uniref:Allantoate amidinohydrolase n=1 Tax=Scyliorhinus torazame TaxID=75743 RepID=A0A401PGC9_SCYTO|nr:hypothetical protein [Scyliorhinus torazame]
MAARPIQEKTGKLPDFVQLNDLACETTGAKILFATDDWFAVAENLLKRVAPQWKAEDFTNFGKWMDGWETRRKRIPDEVPDFPSRGEKMGTAASEQEVEAIRKLKSEFWTELVPMTILQPGYVDTCHNYLPAKQLKRWTHIRLNMYPDGGIARLRVYGIGHRDWSAVSQEQTIDLVAMTNGGVCLGYSDAHFGHPKNIIGIGRSNVMSDGWETARRLDRPPVLKADDQGILQVPGCEWAVFKLGHPGIIIHVEIDTSHFKGNFPDSCKIEGCAISPEEEKQRITMKWKESLRLKWELLLPITKLKPHQQHFYSIEMKDIVTHVRLTIKPDGGISRLRLLGHPCTLSSINL